MKGYQITEEVQRYLDDSSYNYAVLIDGEWGCGKTYYIKKELIPHIEEQESLKEQPRKIKYISLYGCKSIDDIQDLIGWELAEEIKLIKGASDFVEAAAKM